MTLALSEMEGVAEGEAPALSDAVAEALAAMADAEADAAATSAAAGAGAALDLDVGNGRLIGHGAAEAISKFHPRGASVLETEAAAATAVQAVVDSELAALAELHVRADHAEDTELDRRVDPGGLVDMIHDPF